VKPAKRPRRRESYVGRRPVGDVDLVVFAVDDAVLKLAIGNFRISGRLLSSESFFRPQHQSLQIIIEEITQKSLTEKGSSSVMVGEETSLKTSPICARKFRTLAFWKKLEDRRRCKATFRFHRAGNLTNDRVLAIGQTKANQFGGDASATDIIPSEKTAANKPAYGRGFSRCDETTVRAGVAAKLIRFGWPIAKTRYVVRLSAR